MKLLDSLHAFRRHGDLNHYMGIQSGQNLSFCYHAFCIVCQNFCGNRAVHNGSNFLNRSMEVLAFLCNQRRIRGDSGNKAHVIGFADCFYIGGINEKFHNDSPLLIRYCVYHFCTNWRNCQFSPQPSCPSCPPEFCGSRKIDFPYHILRKKSPACHESEETAPFLYISLVFIISLYFSAIYYIYPIHPFLRLHN